MLRNFTTLTDLKAYIPNLDNLLWRDNEDYSAQIEAAEREVRNDFNNMGLAGVYLRPDLTLEDGSTSITGAKVTTTGMADGFNRGRLVINTTALSEDNSVPCVLLGGNTIDGTYSTVTTVTVTATGLSFALLPVQYKYYKINVGVSTGSITANVYLTESNYDTLFIYKTLVIILNSLVKSEGDQWDLKRRMFMQMYSELLNNMKFAYDQDLDEQADTGEVVKNNLLVYYK